MHCTLSQPAAARTGLNLDTNSAAAPGFQDGFIPVCGWCGKVRGPSGVWSLAEPDLVEAAGPTLTHGVCPDCARTLIRKRHEAA
jgi:hypothetical protein